MKLLIVFIVSMILANVAGHINFRNDYNKELKKIAYVLLIIVLVFFAGLRSKYNDTRTYIGAYIDINDTCYLSDFFYYHKLTFGANPGFHFFNSCMKSLGFDAHLFIFVYAAFTIITYLWFITKHTQNLELSIFFFLTTCYLFAFAGIKQAAATAIVLIAIDKAFKAKWLQFVVILLVGMTFHPYVFLFFSLLILWEKKPWSKATIWLIGISLIAGMFYSRFALLASNTALLFGDEYSIEDIEYGKGVNIFRMLIYVVWFIVFFIYRNILYKTSNSKINLFFHFHLIAACFMFIAMFGNQILIGRLPQYFNAMTCLNLSYVMDKLEKDKKTIIIKYITITVFILFFAYEHLYLKPFDRRYEAISLLQFCSSVLKIFQ